MWTPCREAAYQKAHAEQLDRDIATARIADLLAYATSISIGEVSDHDVERIVAKADEWTDALKPFRATREENLWNPVEGDIYVWNMGKLVKAEARRNEPVKAEPDADGWIQWNGGECPVKPGVLVDVKTRIDILVGVGSEDNLDWMHNGHYYNVIAYRIHKPAEPEKPADPHEALRKTWKPGQRWQWLSPISEHWLPRDGCVSEFAWLKDFKYRQCPDDKP